MGEVHRAFDTARERFVALKLLPPELAADELYEERFRREAQLAAKLNNPHIVPIHNFGEIDGRLYIDMRLVEGIDLGRAMDNGPLAPDRAADIISQVADALDAAHKTGLVHRDVKPGNVLLSGNDPIFAYLTDFGIAVTQRDTAITGTGMVIGTWDYLAPERFSSGGPVDHRSDIYSLGCVLYETLVGEKPFPADSLEATITGHLMTPPPRPSAKRPNIPPMFDEVIAHALAKDPAQRYASAGELGAAARKAAEYSVRWGDAPTVSVSLPALRPVPPTSFQPPRTTPGSFDPQTTTYGQLPLGGYSADNTYIRPGISPDRAGAEKTEFEELGLHSPRLGQIRLRADYQLHPGWLPHHAPIPFLGNQKHVDMLRQRLLHSPGGAILLTGFNGVGKTTIVRRALAELRTEIDAGGSDTLSVIDLWETVARPMEPLELMVRLLRNLRDTLARKQLLMRLPAGTAEALTTAYHRTSMTLKSTHSNAIEGSLNLPGEMFGLPGPTLGGKRTKTAGQERSFLPYSLGDAEQDFLRIVSDLSAGTEPQSDPRILRRLFARPTRPWRCRIIVVFDELDKLTADPEASGCFEKLLRQLKNVLASNDAHFIFLAGAETFEAARAARSRVNSDWANVFGQNPAYVGCLQPGASQELLQEVVVDGATGKSAQLLAAYLEYQSRGLPRHLLDGLAQLVQWNPVPHIVIDRSVADLIAFYAALQDRLGPIWADARPLGPLTKQIDIDRMRIAVYQVMDWVLGRAGASFTTADYLADPANSRAGADVISGDEADRLFRELAACGMLESSNPASPQHTMLGAAQPTEVVYQLARAIAEAAHSVTGAPEELGRVGGGRYILREELGRGALGRSYRARDRYTNHDVAIKLLDLPELRHNEVARKRFEREVELYRGLDHPLLAAMSDAIDDEGQLGLVTEFIRGRALSAILCQGQITAPAAVRTGHALADLLAYLDGKDVFRLDLKPSNIVVQNDGRPVVVELGLARRAQDQQSRLTAVDGFVGTPIYLAPEQLRSEESDIRADIYTLGLLIHEMLTGKPVRRGDSIAAIIGVAMKPVDVHGLPCSPEFQHVLAKMLDLDPDARYPKPAIVASLLRGLPEFAPRRQSS
ncbi:protein kinase [Mycobacterium angelicum]|nr:protein kinase [Mycobacterium angelicum]